MQQEAVALAFRDWLLPRMVESIHATETDPNRREGCLAGVEECRKLDSPEAFLHAVAERHQHERALAIRVGDANHSTEAVDEYWRYRCATAQMEFVWNRLGLLWPGAWSPDAPVSAHALKDALAFFQEQQITP